MNSHLVSVEVGVERGTYKGMKLYRSALDKNGFKCLNTKTVKSRRTVEEYRMSLNDIFKCSPYFGSCCSFYHLSCALYIVNLVYAQVNKSFHNKRLEKFKCHLLGKSALIHFKFGTYNDNRTARVVNTLTEKVLTESSLLTFKHIGKRFECTVVGTRNRSSVSAVVDKCVNSLLQHSLFVSDDNFGSFKLKHLFKTVVSVDNSSVKVVKVGCCVSSAVEHNHRSEFGRNNGDNIHYHPFRLVA